MVRVLALSGLLLSFHACQRHNARRATRSRCWLYCLQPQRGKLLPRSRQRTLLLLPLCSFRINSGSRSISLTTTFQMPGEHACCLSLQAQLDKAKDQLSRKMLSTIKYLEHESYREKYRICCKNGRCKKSQGGVCSLGHVCARSSTNIALPVRSHNRLSRHAV